MDKKASMKLRVYCDMDDVLCDFMGAHHAARKKNPAQMYPQAEMDFFRKLKPLDNAIHAMSELSDNYDVWILTRPSVHNPLCYTEKRLWVQDHLGIEFCHKLIICPDKSLLKGDILIDDQKWEDFEGEQLLFGSSEFPDWYTVLNYLQIK